MTTRSAILVVVAVATGVLLVASASLASSQGAAWGHWPAREVKPATVDAPKVIEEIKAWHEQVMAHEPGKLDDAIEEISSWPADRLGFTIEAVVALRAKLDELDNERRARRERIHVFRATEVVVWRDAMFLVGDLQGMLAFAVQDEGRPSAFFRRAATLHADIALFAPDDVSRDSPKGDVVRVIDGRVVGYERTSIHWSLGRRLVGLVMPSPADDVFVRRWYFATVSALVGSGDLAAAEKHVGAAVAVLPADADVQFEAGRFHEAAAQLLSQAPRMVSREQRGARGHWEDAEARFRQAVALDPSHAEARIHLGHVLLELDRPKDAAQELGQALGAITDPNPKYLAAMLLGRAEELLGQRDSAASRFQLAAELVPAAQSPALALSRLARRSGGRVSGERYLHDALSRHDDALAADPWWLYHRWQTRDPETLLEELWALARSEPRS
jgi:tetratricopeptide (TPR) repeat protein